MEWPLQTQLRPLPTPIRPKFSHFAKFGGVYYLYVRGMNGRDETTGVYFRHPTKQDLDLDLILK